MHTLAPLPLLPCRHRVKHVFNPGRFGLGIIMLAHAAKHDLVSLDSESHLHDHHIMPGKGHGLAWHRSRRQAPAGWSWKWLQVQRHQAMLGNIGPLNTDSKH